MLKINFLIEKAMALFSIAFTVSIVTPFFLHAIIDNQALLEKLVNVDIAVLFISILSFLAISMFYCTLNLLFLSKLN